MAQISELLTLAQSIGFSHAAQINMSSLVPMSEVRDMCASGRCQAYGRLWSCPPACGSIEFTTARIRSYDSGIIVQTTGILEDDFDYETISRTQRAHKADFETLARQARIIVGDCLPLSSGGCRICMKCTYPDKPCRFPTRMLSSMEAYGLLVSDVCLRSGLSYNYGTQTITYTSCLLIKQER